MMISPLQTLTRNGIASAIEQQNLNTNASTRASGARGAAQPRATANAASAGAASDSQSGIVPAGLEMKETFLMLLVAQIKNQNPLNPADGTEFLSQLAQFTQVEQLISIRQELESMARQNESLGAAMGRQSGSQGAAMGRGSSAR